jgi:hypothetical protein
MILRRRIKIGPGCHRWHVLILVAAIGGMVLSFPASSIEFGEFVTIDAALRGIVQHGRYNNATNEKGESLDRETGGAAIGDLEIDISPTSRDTFWTRLRFARGNSLNNIGGIKINPYNGPLEDDVRNINDSGRNYLLEVWYRHTFSPGGDTSLAVTGGIIDSTNYIDENRYANDENSQFMNPVFATPDNSIGSPSYDPGGVLQLYANQWSLNVVYMRTSNEILEDTDYFGAQAGYHYTMARGAGNFRVSSFTANGDVKEDKGGGGDATMYGLAVSIDQELGEGWGIFFRAFVQNDEAPIVYDGDLSGGISISGQQWGRPDDVLGIAYGHLFGASRQNIDYTNVAEAYMKFQLIRSVDFTVDVQYEKDHTDSDKGDPQAWIFGGRLNIEF